MAQHIESSPLSLTFLGTSAGGGPSPTRNCLATALNLPNESWLVDCAEGTQHMMMRVGQPSPEKVTRVFITRLRIDHMFGLVPLILTKMYAPRSKHVSQLQTRLRIYGPAGLRAFVRNCLSITNTELVGKYEVIELLRDGEQYTPCNKEALHMNEALGRDIIANADGTWPSFETTSDGWTLSAGPLVTSFPGTSMGFIFQEPHITIPPSKDYVALLHCVSETLFPPGLRTHADLLRQLGNGKSVTLAQGRFVLDPFPRIPGRKVVVLGTTSDASPCAELARNADILVHEATVAPIVETWNGIYVDGVRGEKDTARHAIKWGHSTPTMAGQFAHRIGARVLVMNYFGENLQGIPHEGNPAYIRRCTEKMKEVERQAATVLGADAVAIAAEDGLVVEIPLRTTAEPKKAKDPKANSDTSLSDSFERLDIGSGTSENGVQVVKQPVDLKV